METGTFVGSTTAKAADIFQEVHSIELSQDLYQRALQRFLGRGNVFLYQGDSAQILPSILTTNNGKILLLLDAHYSAGVTARGKTNTPILDELRAIKASKKKNVVILIDDIRYFQPLFADVPEDSGIRGYPTLQEVRDAILEIDENYHFVIIGDVALAYPAEDQVAISPVVQACTLSRLFDDTNDGLKELFDAENTISLEQGQEREEIQLLREHFTSNEQAVGGHYHLWYGLTLLNEKRYDEACQEFIQAIQCRCNHWRVSWYFAEAISMLGNIEQARKSVKAVVDHVPGLGTAQQILNQIKTRPAEIKNVCKNKNELVGIIFSKDRAMQLDGTLRSFLLHCQDYDLLDLKVIYTTSNQIHEKQYHQLIKDYERVEFVKEENFKEDLISLLEPYQYVLFLVDDNLFVREFHLTGIVKALRNNTDVLGFTLRLGKNTTHTIHPVKKELMMPVFTQIQKNILKYDWTKLDGVGFGYPIELQSAVYRVPDLWPIMSRFDFLNPNTLELLLDSKKDYYKENGKHAQFCFVHSVAFTNPINLVQTAWKNWADNKIEYSSEALAQKFSEGYRIDVDAYSNMVPVTSHQVVDLVFQKPVKKQAGEMLETKRCLSSVFKNSGVLPRQDTQTQDLGNAACDVQAVYQEFVVGQASGSNSARLTGQDRDWSDREWHMRSVPNPYGLIEINGVQGFLGQGDVSHLYKKARSLPQNGVIMEIGSFMGLSSIVMGCGLRDSGNYSARIYCVDSWDNRYLEKVEVSDTRELYDIFRENVVRADLQSFIYPIRKRSMEAVADFAINSVDLLFIDGDHSFESCYADLTSWYQKVRPGGIIVGHDCRPGQGVHKAVEKFKSECSQNYLLIPPPETNYMFEMKIRDVPANSIEDMISDKKLDANAAEVNKEQLVSIIILNFNGAAYIQKCIESIKAHTDEPYELIVVDNASTDDSLAYLRTLKEITLVENPENLGCPPARTQAMALAHGEYVVLLDNDTVVTHGWLTAFITHARRNPTIGLLGPCSNHVAGPQKVDEVPYENVQGLESFARTFSDRNRGHLTIVPRLVGFCMFIRRVVVDRIGAPDPRFGKFGFEDDDYTWRAIISGFQAAIAQDIFIHHIGGPQVKGDMQYNQYLLDAWDIFKAKWGLPADLEYGTPFDVADYLAQPFDMAKHFIPVPDKSSIEELITSYGDGSTTRLQSRLILDQEERLAEGERQFETGQYHAAEEIFLKLLEDSPGQAQAHNNLGVLYYTMGNKENALKHYVEAARLLPENVTFQKNLADFYCVEQGQIEKAVKIYLKVLAQHPEDLEILLSLGRILIKLGLVNEARTYYGKFLKIDSSIRAAELVIESLESASHRRSSGDSEVIYCIGDSHVSFFSGKDAIVPCWPFPSEDMIPFFRTFRLGPVLAYNLVKVGTKTRGREALVFCS